MVTGLLGHIVSCEILVRLDLPKDWFNGITINLYTVAEFDRSTGATQFSTW